MALVALALLAACGKAQGPKPKSQVVAQVNDQDIVLDGAHTPAAARALVETWRAEIGDDAAAVVVGMGSDKDLATFLTELRPLSARLVATRAFSPRAASPEAIAAIAEGLGFAVEIAPDVASALRTTRAASGGILHHGR